MALFTWQTIALFPPANENVYPLIPINFIATLFLYNLQRLFYSSQSSDEKYHWYIANRRLLFTIMVLVLMLSFRFMWNYFLDNYKMLAYYLGLGLVSLLYFLPPFPLRKIGVLKPILITTVFVFVGIVIPLDFNFSPDSLKFMAAQFLFILGLCILFDIRDMAYDAVKQIKTIPVILGAKTTRIIVIGLIHAYTVLMAFTNIKGLTAPYITIFFLGNLLTLFASPNRANLYYGFLIDGLIVIQGILIVGMFF